MTVGELKQLLDQVPDDTAVYYKSDSWIRSPVTRVITHPDVAEDQIAVQQDLARGDVFTGEPLWSVCLE